MKKHITISSIFLLFIVSCKNSEEKKDTIESDFYEGCMQSIKKSAGSVYNFKLSQEYCNCVTQSVLPKLNSDEIKQISEPNNQNVLEKINTLVEPCLQHYLTKSESLE